MSWTVDLSTHCGGKFEHFLFEKQAVKYAHENWYYPYIDLKHNFKDSIRIKDDPDGKKEDKKCAHHWVAHFGGIHCDKCQATINTACNHTGSVGCIPCSQGYADEINSGKSPQPELYHMKENICLVCGLPNDDAGNCANKYCLSKKEEK